MSTNNAVASGVDTDMEHVTDDIMNRLMTLKQEPTVQVSSSVLINVCLWHCLLLMMLLIVMKYWQ